MKIENHAWVLPRPASTYPGCFPLHFEHKLLKLLNINPNQHKILQPFGGNAKFGIKCDIGIINEPDYICNAEELPFDDNEFDLVLLDPPYNEDYAKRLYGCKNPSFKKYTKEAVRVCKEGGYVVVYHMNATPNIPDTTLYKRIFIENRMWHQLRCVHIHIKNVGAWQSGRIDDWI